jgi:hypothetical protein
MEKLSSKEGFRGILVISAVGAFCMATTYALSRYFGAPFHWWYADTLPVLFSVVVGTVAAAYAWDVALLLIGVFRSFMREERAQALWHQYSVFKLGGWPHAWLLVTAYWALQTSNIMLLSVYLINQGVTEWKDAWFWSHEAPLMEAIKTWHPNASLWDIVYNACWSLSMVAAMVLLGFTRRASALLPLLCCYVFLFYVGRLVGLAAPVMGPALYRPEYFTHTEGTFSAMATDLVLKVMTYDPELTTRSSVLLGGVSAMPSLHVAMVLAIMYWLAIHDRRTLFYTLPWNTVAVSSTVILGWHYAMDALGGLVLAAFCLVATHLVFRYPFPWQKTSYLNTVRKEAKHNGQKKKHKR